VVYADDINILDGSAHTIKENIESLVIASKGDWTRSKCW